MAGPLLPRRSGTILVTVRLDPPRYDRLKRLVLRLSTTGQSIIQTALDRSLASPERERTQPADVSGQSSLFTAATADSLGGSNMGEGGANGGMGNGGGVTAGGGVAVH